ncbi:hypothetical protein [Pseudorhodoplanes sp.]|uniref:hypothetical protein n=1 Tax=Pseudorhodoplanes sp. TaxID=1934341 RepID=UPI002BB0C3FD|nr:hypothetical protein [Pseudorhodoplanes sp.]HWV52804.1 hypothetical protein [Pseudorhodoplanes sp.]
MLVIAGDSHAIAIRQGFDALHSDERHRLVQKYNDVRIGMLQAGFRFMKRFHKVFDEAIVFNASIANRLEKIGVNAAIQRNDDRTFVFSIGTHGLRLYIDPAWSKFTLIPRSEKLFVSRGAMTQIVRSYNQNVIRFYDDLLDLGVSFYVLVSCPMPLAQWEFRQRTFETPNEFATLFETFQDVAVEMMLGRGVKVLRPPSSVLDGRFLRKDLQGSKNARDYHGNSKYGEIIWRDVLMPELGAGYRANLQWHPNDSRSSAVPEREAS